MIPISEISNEYVILVTAMQCIVTQMISGIAVPLIAQYAGIIVDLVTTIIAIQGVAAEK
ncbi:MAG: hypothetical protein HGB00_04620 [Chlorobiaceae bacterium]|nr:hypothetical protein [Chlorobiaceae bacterium]